MKAFVYKRGALHAEGVPVASLAERFGTPLFIYSRTHIQSQYRALQRALRELRPLICYSVKVNTSAAVISTLAAEGSGADVVSGGELYRALRAGIPADRIAFAGVGKTEEEIAYALKEGILFFTVESEQELARISAVARRQRRTARVALRVNPDVDPKTHKFISTGKKENKFGMDLGRARDNYALAARLPNLEIAGLHMHIGSQILSASPFAQAARKVAAVVTDLKSSYPTFRYLDIGGGIGIQYRPEQEPLDPAVFAKAVVPILKPLDVQVVMEPGRNLVGNAGILVVRVQYVKKGPGKKFIIVDGAMNDLIRPPLYDAHHEVIGVRRSARRAMGDVVGPICESADYFALDRDLPDVGQGDLLAVLSAGAYSMSMSSNYNSRPRAAEVMVAGRRVEVIRPRQAVKDLVAGERIPAW